MELTDLVRASSPLAMQLAVTHVRTLAGAIRLWRAERDTHARPVVMQAIEARIARLRGESASSSPRLIAAGRMEP